MIPQVNVKARIDRHSRILKDNISFKSKVLNRIKRNRLWYKIVIIVMVLLMPVYPLFASFVYNNNEYDFIREWYIDESSILWSYYTDKKEEELERMYEAKESYLSVSTILADDRDFSWTNEISDYIVKEWDTISSIASKFKVTKDTIIWANNLDANKKLKVWIKLIIPPVSGILYKVKSWDTIDAIAKKYSISSEKIRKQNLIWNRKDLKIWEILVLPGAKKIIPKPKLKPKPKVIHPSKTKNSWRYNFSNYWKTQYSTSKWVYKLTRKPSYHTFYRWNCTRYVAKYKKVTWWWNANAWLRNARAKWIPTWKTPTLWAIVVLNWRWYNPRYWHVAIVMEIKKNYLIVSDMNYRRLWEVTYRKILKSDRAIRWYIYVD